MPLFYYFNYDLKIVSVYVFLFGNRRKVAELYGQNNVYFYRT